MNRVFANGNVLTIPKLSIMIGEGLPICKLFIQSNQQVNGENIGNPDLFPAICFGDTARYMNDKFNKGDSVVLYGYFKNYHYYDNYKGKHRTQVLVITEIADPQNGTVKNKSQIEEESCEKMIEKGFSLIDEKDLQFLEKLY